MNDKTNDFLRKYNQHPEQIDLNEITNNFIEEMKLGLNGDKSSLMMLPTYLTCGNTIPMNKKAITIDAGGTNLRIANVTFTNEGIKIENFHKQKMLGVEKDLTKTEFLDQLSSLIIPLLEQDNKIGFCFSFAAKILPNRDGQVINFSKEIKLDECVGMLLAAELKKEFENKGINKKTEFVVLNDTVSTLLGGPAISEKEKVDGQIGLILGTGTNTAYLENSQNIKLATCDQNKMIINMESAEFDKLAQGYFDKIVDNKSVNPAIQIFEKMISGIYLGNVIYETILQASKENMFSSNNIFDSLQPFDMVTVDSFLREPYGNNPLANCCHNDYDVEMLYDFASKAIERASKLVVANLAACILKMDGGKNISAPCRIVVEGSTYHKCYSYKEWIDYYMKEFVYKQLHRSYKFVYGDDVNLIGSATAALLNI